MKELVFRGITTRDPEQIRWIGLASNRAAPTEILLLLASTDLPDVLESLSRRPFPVPVRDYLIDYWRRTGKAFPLQFPAASDWLPEDVLRELAMSPGPGARAVAADARSRRFMTAVCWMGVAELAEAFAARRLSPVAVLEALLARIAAVDPLIDAFVRLDGDAALHAARIAEREIAAGRMRSPLHGVPVGIKDVIDVAGLPTTCHSRILLDHVAREDATLVVRLRAAGAIVLGKLFAALCHLAILMVCSLPIVMLCLPLGGVSPYEVFAAYFAMISTVGLFGMISLWASSYFRRTSASLVVSYLLILPLALGGRRIAGAVLDADRQAHFADRLHQVALDVDGKRLQG